MFDRDFLNEAINKLSRAQDVVLCAEEYTSYIIFLLQKKKTKKSDDELEITLSRYPNQIP